MRKARDVEQATAEALLALVKQAAPTPDHVGTILDVIV